MYVLKPAAALFPAKGGSCVASGRAGDGIHTSFFSFYYSHGRCTVFQACCRIDTVVFDVELFDSKLLSKAFDLYIEISQHGVSGVLLHRLREGTPYISTWSFLCGRPSCLCYLRFDIFIIVFDIKDAAALLHVVTFGVASCSAPQLTHTAEITFFIIIVLSFL